MNIKHFIYIKGRSKLSYWSALIFQNSCHYLSLFIIPSIIILFFDYRFLTSISVLICDVYAFSIFNNFISFFYSSVKNCRRNHLYFQILVYILLNIIENSYFFQFNFKFSILPLNNLMNYLSNLTYVLYSQDSKISFDTDFTNTIKLNLLYILYSLIDCAIYLIFLFIADNELLSKYFVKLLLIIKNRNLVSEYETLNKYSLSLNKVTMRYFSCKKKGIIDIDLGVEIGERFGLLGPNGSGKTSLFKLITQEKFIQKGKINLYDSDISTEFSNIVNNIGYLPQNDCLFEDLSVEENLNFYLQLHFRMDNYLQVMDFILKKNNLTPYRDVQVLNLSQGNKRKLSIAIALLNNPKLLLLDEPTAGVDHESKRVIWKNINNYLKSHPNSSLILSTHSFEEAELICDNIAWLRNGKIIKKGNPEKIKYELSNGYIMMIKLSQNENVHEVELSDNELRKENLSKLFPYSQLINEFKNENLNLTRHSDISKKIFYLRKINEIIKTIHENIISIKITNQFDNCFEFFIKLNDNSEGKVYSKIIQLKNEDNEIEEITMKTQSLEKSLNNLNV